MVKITVEVDGMACGMCESHINDAIRNAFNVKKVSSSRSKKRTELISEDPMDEDELKKIITAMGYTPGRVIYEPYNKKGRAPSVR